MNLVTTDYLGKLPVIYRDILKTFRMFNPKRHQDEGVAFQTLYSGLHDKYTLAEIRVACERMEQNDVVQIRNGIFVYPTDAGEELIDRLTVDDAPEITVPDFPPIPKAAVETTGET